MWTRKRTQITGMTDAEDDWEVFRDRRLVGRVYATRIPDPDLRWLWVVWGAAPAQGYAPTMAGALNALRDSFESG